MSTIERRVVPLPESLNACGCPHAVNGMHLTSCRPAREHAATPLRERPDYEEGASYRCVSWQYPVEISARINLTVRLDPAAYIRLHLAAYDDFQMESGYEDWEKPMAFIASQIEEAAGEVEATFMGWPSYIAKASTFVDDCTEYPRWTAEDTAQIDAIPRIDPNQGVLL